MAYYRFDRPRRELITGYHGTSTSLAHAIVAKGFTCSNSPGEWLGHGVYFWDQLDAAWMWGERRHKRCAVVEASLYLGNCLDLDDMGTLGQFLKEVAAELGAELEERSLPLPVNQGDDHRLHCALLNKAAQATFPETDSIIRACPAGDRLMHGSDLLQETRRQICIRKLQHIVQPVLHLERL